ncbi:glycosyltransferase family 2 protein [Mycetocola zhadangensis]|uniref:Glycosyltransferase n=1 Tax=Mycetocola zhadangensis TaxID=1164595 RepID=A0A3L7ITL1_9MICO|nr:glycosyltransferase family 2 protein [Mycetocola zhadangensis]RLQ81533.1 glycosyltransferase [Mycetocola zhadangensis]RLQ82487.1 glycosyltransferase [Mycetocola zhadangensis]GGF00891.1 glycosyl transferase [Mycetocola zhadangensis]
MATIAAVIVTFNRLEKLKTVIESIEAQARPVDALIIVDNASTDGTGQYLQGLPSSDRLEIVTLGSNTGGAGGFSTGMRRAYDLGHDFVWIMDDDCYPAADSLSELERGYDAAVGELGPDVPFACSLVNFVDGSICEMNNPETTWDWARLISRGQNSVMVKSCSFVSVLIPRWAIEKNGLPYAEYFIWFDDHEYTLRLTAICPGVQVLSSVVVHDMGDNRGVNFGMIDDRNAWKFAYGVRNEGSYRLHHQNVFSFLIFAARVVIGMKRGKVAWRHRVTMFGKLAQAVGFNPRRDFPQSLADA